jgi:GDP-L-fucose synthase
VAAPHSRAKSINPPWPHRGQLPNGVRGKRLLVTGGSGFVGKRVCELLEQRGATQVTVPRRRDYDLTHPDSVSRLIEDAQPDTVIHLAAEVGGIGANRANPGRYFYTNMAMGLHLIEEARRCSIEKLVEVGTVASYPKNTPVPFHEESLWEGYPEKDHAPYAIAMKALLVMLQAYREQYGLNGIYLMPVNIYGPGDKFDLESSHVIPALIRKCEEARRAEADSIECWGTGRASREFLYVDDAAEAIVLAAERYDEPDPVNIGSGSEITIRELTEMIAELTGFEGKLVWDPTKPEGHPRRRIDASRAREKFGFEAKTPLREGLRRTIEWYRAQVGGAVPA